MVSNFRFNSLKQIFFGQEEEEKEETMKDTSNQEGDKQIIPKKEIELAIPETIRSEFHFLKFPFFDLCPRTSKKDRIEVKEVEETTEGKIEVWWKVSRNIDSDLPSSFARKIHKEVVEKTLNGALKPIQRLIRLGSMRQICKDMNIAASGKSIKEIKKALQDIKAATIEAKGTFRKKEKNGAKKFFEGSFNLYDMIFFTGETLPDGAEADAVYILLNDMYVQNFNNNFVVPLDYQYFQVLRGDISSRMYEVLSVWFYPALENGKTYIEKWYSELCNYFPLIRQNKQFKAKGILKDAHQQHVKNGFLAREPEWIDTSKKDDWLIRYYIGPKASNWYKQNKKVSPLAGEIKQLEKPLVVKKLVREEKKEENIPEQQAKTEENPLVKQLVDLGITQRIAKKLVEQGKPELIEAWIGAINDVSAAKDKAAFLVRAIQEDWALPEIYKQRKEQKKKQEEEQVKLRKREEEGNIRAQYQNYRDTAIETYLKQIPPEQYEQNLVRVKQEFLKTYPMAKHWDEASVLRHTLEAIYKEEVKKLICFLTLEEWAKQEGITLPQSLKESLLSL